VSLGVQPAAKKTHPTANSAIKDLRIAEMCT